MKVSFAFLDSHDERLLRAIVKTLACTNKLELEISDEFKNDKLPKVVFLSLNDCRSRILLEVNQDKNHYTFITCANWSELESEVGQSMVDRLKSFNQYHLEKPFASSKIFDILKQKLDTQHLPAALQMDALNSIDSVKVSWEDICNKFSNENVLLYYGQDVSLLSKEQKQVYSSPSNKHTLQEMVKNAQDIMLSPIASGMAELSAQVKKWNLVSVSSYDELFYSIYFSKSEHKRVEGFIKNSADQVFFLSSYPNFYPDIEKLFLASEEDKKSLSNFYQVSFYLCKNKACFNEVKTKFGVDSIWLGKYLYSLHQLSYLQSSDHINDLSKKGKQLNLLGKFKTFFSK